LKVFQFEWASCQIRAQALGHWDCWDHADLGQEWTYDYWSCIL
jgi:hypothetical protein